MLLFDESQDCVLVFRRDRDFHHIYHVAGSLEALASGLGNVNTAAFGSTITADLVGRGDALKAVTRIYASQKFVPYKLLTRMIRIRQGLGEGEFLDLDVRFAAAHDAGAIVMFLERQLDRFAEQVPGLEDIVAACGKRNILLIRNGMDLAGILHFESTGLTSILRYWLVDERFRNQGVGSRLIRTMFRLCNAARRVLLWVIADNESAIAKYKRYGFGFEGLVDQVMIMQGRI